MINEERVKLMTRLALFRQKEERRSLEINRSRRFDYLWLNIVKTIICFTLAAVIIVAICLLCLLMQPGAWGLEQLLFFSVTVLVVYLVGVVAAALTAYVISDNRYEESNKKVHEYQTMLRRMKWLYERENRK